MGFLDVNVDDAKEPVAVEGGKEYLIRLLDITEGVDKNGHPYALALLDIPQEPYSKMFNHFLNIPYEGMEPKRLNEVKWQIKVFKQAFKIADIKDVEMVKGSQAWAILGDRDDEQYGKQNYVKKFVRPA